MATDKIGGVMALRRKGRLLLGRDHIKGLEALARAGGNTRAARTAEFSYKVGWDVANGIIAFRRVRLSRPAEDCAAAAATRPHMRDCG
jgi:hypothetical protein